MSTVTRYEWNMYQKQLHEATKRKGLKDFLDEDPTLMEKVTIEEFEERTGRDLAEEVGIKQLFYPTSWKHSLIGKIRSEIQRIYG